MTDRATHRTPNGPPTGPAARPGRGAGQPPQYPPDHQEARDDDHDPQDGNQDLPDGGHEPRDSAPDPQRDSAQDPQGDRGPDPAQLGDPTGTAGADRPHRRNTRLAALIAEAGFSHAGLARRVDRLGQEHGLDLRYDKTSVTRWLRGQQPRGTSPALIAEVFTQRLGRRLSAQDLGLDACAPVYAGLEYAATAGEAVDIVSGLWRKDTGSQAELRKIAFSPAGLVVPSRDWLIGSADDTVVRKAAERVPAQNRGMPRAAQDLRPAAPNSAGRVGAGDIAALRAVGDLFRTLDHAYGGGHARQALIRYLEHEAEPMLRGGYGETQGRRLFASVADLTRLAGWTSYDIGAHGLAQRYFVQALRLTQAAGDRIYGGYVLVTMSRQAVHLGHGREAVQLARVAQQGIGTGAPGAVQALTYAAEARGHGVLGDSRACTAALVRAERAFGAARPGDELPSWARFFDEAQLADEFGHCHRDLQQHRAAAQQAERSLQLRAPGYARSRLFCRAVLASARLSLGDLDAACALGAEVVRQAADMRSVRAAEYARDFARRLDPYRDTSAARAFHVRAEAAGFPL
ncbi:regulator [Streptomyces sp. IBSBF 2435]|uniref:regulator n=1 Tax=Streptomyces sp. IBSBF 2435 TaxID=2903531 RepID=UPI002FDBAEB3